MEGTAACRKNLFATKEKGTTNLKVLKKNSLASIQSSPFYS